MPGLGFGELMFVAVIGLLLFGSRLPEVMRSLGKGVMEFKKGMNDIQDEFRGATNSYRSALNDDRPAVQPTAAKFEPPSEETSSSDSAQVST